MAILITQGTSITIHSSYIASHTTQAYYNIRNASNEMKSSFHTMLIKSLHFNNFPLFCLVYDRDENVELKIIDLHTWLSLFTVNYYFSYYFLMILSKLFIYFFTRLRKFFFSKNFIFFCFK